MRTDIITNCCEDLPAGTPAERHITVSVTAGHGRILRLDIDGLGPLCRGHHPVRAAELRRLADILDPQETQP